MSKAIALDGFSLTLDDVARVSRGGVSVGLTPDAWARVVRARTLVESKAAGDDPVYGVNTGFGYLARVRVPQADLAQLQLNLIRSHAVGTGSPLSREETRALMLLRANVMATGHSGVRQETLQLMLDMLAADVLPIVYDKGSVGASGDLAPLAHLALAMVGEGECWSDGEPIDSAKALEAAGLKPLVPAAKEGLCLVNGTQAMAALGTLTLLQAEELCRLADITGAASLEGARGTRVAFDDRIARVRPHPGHAASAANLRAILGESEIAESHADCDRVQDAYSFRCMPQVHGATRDALAFVRQTLNIEINAATDNPLVFAELNDGGEMLSGGNFHGQALALALDILAMATSELANMSDRRVEQLIDPALSGLPAFLSPDPGLNSGFMMAQVTAASLVNENKMWSMPASVDSIPTSANREDHVSMGMTSARKAREVVKNVRTCLSIELMAALQAIDLHGGLQAGLGVMAAHRVVRAKVPKLEQDRVLFRDMQVVESLVPDVIAAVQEAVGPLA